jgi:hypothetical protein
VFVGRGHMRDASRVHAEMGPRDVILAHQYASLGC